MIPINVFHWKLLGLISSQSDCDPHMELDVFIRFIAFYRLEDKHLDYYILHTKQYD